MLRLAGGEQIEHDLGIGNRHRRDGIFTEQIDRDGLRRIVVRELGMILFIAKFDQMPMVRPFFGMGMLVAIAFMVFALCRRCLFRFAGATSESDGSDKGTENCEVVGAVAHQASP